MGLWLGPLLFVAMATVADIQSIMATDAWLVAGVAIWMAVWWSTEAIPVPATAFLPLVLFPMIEVAPIRAVAQSYSHPTIYLFLGAFILALSVEKWGLHRRIALWVLSRTGTDARALI